MRGFLSRLCTVACAAGASGMAGSAPGLAAMQLLLLEQNPSRQPERAVFPEQPPLERTQRRSGFGCARMLPCAAELQASLREVSISS